MSAKSKEGKMYLFKCFCYGYIGGFTVTATALLVAAVIVRNQHKS